MYLNRLRKIKISERKALRMRVSERVGLQFLISDLLEGCISVMIDSYHKHYGLYESRMKRTGARNLLTLMKLARNNGIVIFPVRKLYSAVSPFFFSSEFRLSSLHTSYSIFLSFYHTISLYLKHTHTDILSFFLDLLSHKPFSSSFFC